ncbi:metallopeptidase family protein [Oscillibacter sp.]|uniref:metallopeptidase family protein n=1 Tax=Oscillibacter sp. TaxID=1945593 RepID=UPI00289FF2AB|nr:metallopeptidase family protein [Oscillibacter sp.]
MKLLTFDETGDLLDRIAEQFPQVLFQGLNGGVNLKEEALPDPEFPGSELYIMGQFCDNCLGKYIDLYYGSFAVLAKLENWTEEDWEDELWTTLSHELTHHMEGLGGLHALDDRDEEEMTEFRRKYEARAKLAPRFAEENGDTSKQQP